VRSKGGEGPFIREKGGGPFLGQEMGTLVGGKEKKTGDQLRWKEGILHWVGKRRLPVAKDTGKRGFHSSRGRENESEIENKTHGEKEKVYSESEGGEKQLLEGAKKGRKAAKPNEGKRNSSMDSGGGKGDEILTARPDKQRQAALCNTGEKE